MPHRVFLSLGTNLGDREDNLQRAVVRISEVIGRVTRRSVIVESDAVGFKSDDRFYNIVLEVETEHSPEEVLRLILDIERAMGRERSEHMSSRIIDIDLLLYDDRVIETRDLVVPHPRMHERNFVLVPFAQAAGSIVHPILKKTVKQMLLDANDNSEVHILSL